jgi:cyclic beta-1,2-glucan synthetase
MASVLFITVIASAIFALWLVRLGVLPFLIVILVLLFFLPLHDAAEIFVCKFIMILLKPYILPEMDFTEGIPDEFKTLIVYASLLSDKELIVKTLAHMEKTYLANKDRNLPIAILTHFKDSLQEEVTTEESELLNIAAVGIETLNKKYGRGLFFLFHRDKKWNIVSKKWVGWERKRGGVEELNRWLLGKIQGESYREQGPGKTFSRIAGDIDTLSGISKVILLDSDNILPKGSAARLVAKAVHSKNQPMVSKTDEIVNQGYGVLQPFPVPSEGSCQRSFFARMEGWNRRPNGPHHYILQALQNLCKEGTYIGKGIYDVATHERVLANRFPDNQLLSHDKAESGFLRAALVTDVIILEEALDNFLAGMSQIERWLRGDKQAIHWAFPRIPNKKKEYVKNPLSLFSRWNLIWPIKKQLSIPSLVMLCWIGWFVPELSSLWCSLILMIMIAFPYVIVPLNPRHPVSSLVGIVRGLVSTVVYLAFTLQRAISILTAMVRITFQLPDREYVRESIKEVEGGKGLSVLRKSVKIFRILAGSVLRRPNIDWVTASDVKRRRKIYRLPGIITAMFPSLMMCIALGVGALIFVADSIYVLPFLVLWLMAPLIVYATSSKR